MHLESHGCQTVDRPAHPHQEAKKPRPFDLKTLAGRPPCPPGSGLRGAPDARSVPTLSGRRAGKRSGVWDSSRDRRPGTAGVGGSKGAEGGRVRGAEGRGVGPGGGVPAPGLQNLGARGVDRCVS